MLRFGYNQVIFETDSMVLARIIAGTEAIWPKLQLIIQEIAYSLSLNPSYKVEFYSREGNKTADGIGKKKISFLNHVPKLYSLKPRWLKSVLEVDMPRDNNNAGLNSFG